MAQKYSNFVRPSSPNEAKLYTLYPTLNGNEARKLYLEEVREIGNPEPAAHDDADTQPRDTDKVIKNKTFVHTTDITQLSTKDLFLSAQNNDVDSLRCILDNFPDKINAVDDYGWSLLMIACQAESLDIVKELIHRDIDMSIRDKAGNSAQSLVIKNKNLVLADLLLSRKKTTKETEQEHNLKEVKLKQDFICNICSKTFPNKEEHLSSTLHNINASKGKIIPANYVIPTSNKGYQLMLKEGWDRKSGLGPDGSGRRYPIKTVQKKDRKGLGNKQKKESKDPVKQKKVFQRNCGSNRRMEINFRREFY